MTARVLMRIVREGWAIILATTIVLTIGGGVYAATRTPMYQATSTLAVSACIAVENLDTCDPVGGMAFAIERARIYASTGTSAPVLRRALNDTGIVTERKKLAENISVAYTSGSPLIDVTATWTDPNDAAELANAVSGALIEYSREAIDSFESDATEVQFSVISAAVAASEPVESDSRTIVLSLILSILIGFGFATLRWLLDTRIRDTAEAESATGLDVLAELPIGAKPSATTQSPVLQPSAASGAFHQLRAIVCSRASANNQRVIAVISPTRSDMASAVTNGLADSLVATRQRVAILHLHDVLGGVEGTGDIRDVVDNGASATDLFERLGDRSPMRFVYAGGEDESAIAFATPEFASFVEALRDAVDIVLIDSASANAGAQMIAAARHADAALLVIGLGGTPRADLADSLRTLDLIDVPQMGIAAVTRAK